MRSPSLVWYVSYGSNMSSARLDCYLRGGRPPGGSRVHPGARDPRPPERSVPVHLPGRLFFAGESRQWGGGGIAFYDHRTPGGTAARGHLVSVGQFADIAAQEMHRAPVEADPLETLLALPLEGGRHRVGPGLYETLLDVGSLEGAPMLTFTCPHGAHAVPHTRPSPAYVETLGRGLREAHGWDDDQIADYLADRVGSGTARSWGP